MSEIFDNPFLSIQENRDLTDNMIDIIENSSTHEEEMASITSLRKYLINTGHYNDAESTEAKMYLAYIAAQEILEETKVAVYAITPEDFND